MRGLIDKLKKNLVDFGQDESGMGVIEVILISPNSGSIYSLSVESYF